MLPAWYSTRSPTHQIQMFPYELISYWLISTGSTTTLPLPCYPAIRLTCSTAQLLSCSPAALSVGQSFGGLRIV
uniref:Uncharacterized protein n=1 Tax=Picea glauca TaxID=3330 RepID=A0A101LW33_PICGL|nr:hypothetical protein ABT39_MTgene1504 [Picea glauca]QHR90872.1 hypothetical protein Q903MT_gene4899 [Picea sitchensis]